MSKKQVHILTYMLREKGDPIDADRLIDFEQHYAGRDRFNPTHNIHPVDETDGNGNASPYDGTPVMGAPGGMPPGGAPEAGAPGMGDQGLTDMNTVGPEQVPPPPGQPGMQESRLVERGGFGGGGRGGGFPGMGPRAMTGQTVQSVYPGFYGGRPMMGQSPQGMQPTQAQAPARMPPRGVNYPRLPDPVAQAQAAHPQTPAPQQTPAANSNYVAPEVPHFDANNFTLQKPVSPFTPTAGSTKPGGYLTQTSTIDSSHETPAQVDYDNKQGQTQAQTRNDQIIDKNYGNGIAGSLTKTLMPVAQSQIDFPGTGGFVESADAFLDDLLRLDEVGHSAPDRPMPAMAQPQMAMQRGPQPSFGPRPGPMQMARPSTPAAQPATRGPATGQGAPAGGYPINYGGMHTGGAAPANYPSVAPRNYAGFSGPQAPPPDVQNRGPDAIRQWQTQMNAVGNQSGPSRGPAAGPQGSPRMPRPARPEPNGTAGASGAVGPPSPQHPSGNSDAPEGTQTAANAAAGNAAANAQPVDKNPTRSWQSYVPLSMDWFKELPGSVGWGNPANTGNNPNYKPPAPAPQTNSYSAGLENGMAGFGAGMAGQAPSFYEPNATPDTSKSPTLVRGGAFDKTPSLFGNNSGNQTVQQPLNSSKEWTLNWDDYVFLNETDKSSDQ